MEIRTERQLNPVADEVSAITAVVRPILIGVLYALKSDVVAEAGGREGVKLKMLPRLRRTGDGDCGIWSLIGNSARCRHHRRSAA